MATRKDAAERLLHNPDFLAGALGKMLNLNAAALGCVAILAGVTVYREWKPLPREYFAMTPEFDPIPMRPLSEPAYTGPEVVQWAVDAVLKAYNLNHLEYLQQSDVAKVNFRNHAWNGWAGSFKANGNLGKLLKGRMQSRANTHWPAYISHEGVRDGRYTWVIEFPMDLAFVNSNGGKPERRWVVVKVVRTEEPRFARRIAIDQLVDRQWPGDPDGNSDRTASR